MARCSRTAEPLARHALRHDCRMAYEGNDRHRFGSVDDFKIQASEMFGYCRRAAR